MNVCFRDTSCRLYRITLFYVFIYLYDTLFYSYRNCNLPMACATTPTTGVGDVGANGDDKDKGGESPTGLPTPIKKGRKPAAAKRVDPPLTFDWLPYVKNQIKYRP